MCGICGYMDFNQKIDLTLLERMNNVVDYRGPDDEGYLLIDENSTLKLRGNDTVKSLDYLTHVKKVSDHNFPIGMSHRRLSIIDLSPMGHQPMTEQEGDIAIVFNGEIYNYIELRNELQIEGFHFITSTDTEVIIKSYQKWGEDCVKHFNGMWAFAIWDAKNAKLFCSRDRLGAKPFYYYTEEGRFVFASEMKQICQDSKIEKYLNIEAVTNYIMWGSSDYDENTWIDGVFELRGGNNLSIEVDWNGRCIKNIRLYPYWSLDYKNKLNDISELYEELERSVEWRLRSDVPVGIMLSGGLDSSCLTAIAVEKYRKVFQKEGNINTFTTCFENFTEGDERNFAHAVNEFCKTKENFIYPETEDSFETLKKMVWHFEGECGFQRIGSFLTLKEVAKSGVKVILNGQGADETMMGYERYYAFYLKELLKNGDISEFIKALRAAADNSRLSYRELIGFYLYFSKPYIRKNRCQYRMKKYVSKDILRRFKKNKKIYSHLFFKNEKELLENEVRGTQLSHILRYDDRGYMAYSLEGRVPFIDYRYVEKAVRIPAVIKIQQGYTKYLLRNYLREKLPSDIVWRKNKMGWPSPAKKWVSGFDKKKVEELFDNSRSSSLFHLGEIKELYQKNPTARPVEVFFILELFMEQFDVKVRRYEKSN